MSKLWELLTELPEQLNNDSTPPGLAGQKRTQSDAVGGGASSSALAGSRVHKSPKLALATGSIAAEMYSGEELNSLGPTSWISRLQRAFRPELAGKMQQRPAKVWTGCSGTDAPVLGLQVCPSPFVCGPKA